MAITKTDGNVSNLQSITTTDSNTPTATQNPAALGQIDSLLSLLQNQIAAGDLTQGRSTLVSIQSILRGSPATLPGTATTGDLRLDQMLGYAQQAEDVRLSTEAIAQTAEAWTAETIPDDATLESLEADVGQSMTDAKAAYESALTIYNAMATDDPQKKSALDLLGRVRTARDYAIANGDRAMAAYQNVIGEIQPGAVELHPDGKFYLHPDQLGRFVVNGTDTDDTIIFGQDGDNVFYEVNHQRIYLDHTQGSEVVVNLKGGNDQFDARAIDNGNFKFKINGEDGDDTLMGSGGDDYIVGGEGNDTIYSQGGADIIDIKDSFNTAAAFHDTVFNGNMKPRWGAGSVDYQNAGEIEVIANDEFGSDSINPVEYSTQAQNAREATAQTTINGRVQAFDEKRIEALRAEERRKLQELWSQIP